MINLCLSRVTPASAQGRSGTTDVRRRILGTHTRLLPVELTTDLVTTELVTCTGLPGRVNHHKRHQNEPMHFGHH